RVARRRAEVVDAGLDRARDRPLALGRRAAHDEAADVAAAEPQRGDTQSRPSQHPLLHHMVLPAPEYYTDSLMPGPIRDGSSPWISNVRSGFTRISSTTSCSSARLGSGALDTRPSPCVVTSSSGSGRGTPPKQLPRDR